MWSNAACVPWHACLVSVACLPLLYGLFVNLTTGIDALKRCRKNRHLPFAVIAVACASEKDTKFNIGRRPHIFERTPPSCPGQLILNNATGRKQRGEDASLPPPVFLSPSRYEVNKLVPPGKQSKAKALKTKQMRTIRSWNSASATSQRQQFS